MKRYTLKHERQVIEYEIVHRPKVTRRIHLELAAGGNLQVVTPRRMSKRLIQSTMQSWASYVARFLAEARAQQRDIPQYGYVSGEHHWFMGGEFPLRIRELAGKRARVELADGEIGIVAANTSGENIRGVLTAWYRLQAMNHFGKRLTAFSQAAPWTGGKLPAMRLRRMKSTWGTCSSTGVITLNPHLVKAPPACIDYVVAHEICHLREHNHGRGFYALQEQLYPGWRAAKEHLRSRGHVYLNV